MSERVKSKSPLAKRLKEARSRLGLSQKKLGALAGIDEFSASARINQYERGKHVPDFSVARKLAQAMDVPVTYLYADNDELAEAILSFAKADANTRAKALKTLRGSQDAHSSSLKTRRKK